MLRTFYYRSSC